jgi:hypothetical protein
MTLDGIIKIRAGFERTVMPSPVHKQIYSDKRTNLFLSNPGCTTRLQAAGAVHHAQKIRARMQDLHRQEARPV